MIPLRPLHGRGPGSPHRQCSANRPSVRQRPQRADPRDRGGVDRVAPPGPMICDGPPVPPMAWQPKTIGAVRDANMRLVVKCRRCLHFAAFYQTPLNRFLDRARDMTLDDLRRRSVCGICGGRNPLVMASATTRRSRPRASGGNGWRRTAGADAQPRPPLWAEAPRSRLI